MFSSIRTALTPTATLQLLLGWGSVLILVQTGPALGGPLTTPGLFIILGVIIAVVLSCAFGVVRQAEYLAQRLGDPYGTLVLTLSIVIIEVILISAVMLGPGEHLTIARDSVMAVSMIILNFVIGIAILVGATRHANLQSNSVGVSAYLSILAVLLVVAFALPHFLGASGMYAPLPAIVVVGLTLIMYGYFLYRQLGQQRSDFQEVTSADSTKAVSAQPQQSLSAVLAQHRGEILTRTTVLVFTVVPIVLLSHEMAALLDQALEHLGAPIALSGILIAAIVFLPETITAIRAAYLGEMQRVSNLCHGALVSTVGLTIPAVLIIGLVTAQPVVLAESPENLLLLAVTLCITTASMLGKRATALHGAAHLMVFVLYLLVVFS
ncbi:calcium:proton antiporter [Yaniella halotolerans]|uniref:calcium:proton antiporter n=1 Tax=Yaniella halotolerans TaxID=225453 RepID=UPI0003B4EA35|nr:calcium:proton antiporter [Yaniella halotolerans]